MHPLHPSVVQHTARLDEREEPSQPKLVRGLAVRVCGLHNAPVCARDWEPRAKGARIVGAQKDEIGAPSLGVICLGVICCVQ